jgi:hypothetical protein
VGALAAVKWEIAAGEAFAPPPALCDRRFAAYKGRATFRDALLPSAKMLGISKRARV